MTQNNFIITLVDPEIPENLGFILRLCANFGDIPLRIVLSPGKKNILSRENAEKICRTAVHAKEDTAGIRSFETLEEAIFDCRRVIGFTAKSSVPHQSVSSLWQFQLYQPEIMTAFVFGSESSGLSHHDLQLCHHLCSIPTNARYPSMNVSHAVAVVLATACRERGFALFEEQDHAGHKPVEQAQISILKKLWTTYLQRIGFAHNEAHARHIRRRMQQFFIRLNPNENEAALIAGIAKQSLWALDQASLNFQPPDGTVTHNDRTHSS